MKNFIILILLFTASFIGAQDQNFTLTKDRILEIASTSSAANQLMNQYYPEAFIVERPQPTIESTIDLSLLTMRNRQFYLGNKYFGAINQSPFYLFTNKAILVDNAYKPSIQVVNGRDLIVFELK